MTRRLVFVAFAGLALAGCARTTPCELIADEIRAKLEGCGVAFPHYTDDLAEECTEDVQALDECLLVCYREGSCAEFESSAFAGGDLFHACANACVVDAP